MSGDLKTVISIAKEAGSLLVNYYDTKLAVEMKSNNTPVTEADKTVDKFLRKKISEFSPYPILSEESVDDPARLGSEFLWCVDPLDGTKGFISKNGDFAVQIGLARNNQPILGVVFKPVGEELYYGTKGAGSFCIIGANQPKQLRVSTEEDVSKMKMMLSRSTIIENNFFKQVAERLGIKEFISSGGYGIRFGFIARGEPVVVMQVGNKGSEWDSCAPQIILEEAGGRVTDLSGEAFKYNKPDVILPNGTLATNGRVHDEVLRAIQELGF